MQYSDDENVIDRLIFDGQLVVCQNMERMVRKQTLRIINPFGVRVKSAILVRLKHRTVGSRTRTKVRYRFSVKSKPGLNAIVDIYFGKPFRTYKPMIKPGRK